MIRILHVAVMCACLAMASHAYPGDKTKLAPSVDWIIATTAVNALGMDLLNRLPDQSGNAALSPYSIQVVLAMTYGGAAGRTLAEMKKALHYPAKEADLH